MIWEGAASRSFAEVDGQRRLSELISAMVPANQGAGDSFMVYPASDARFTRVLKKVVRGLCYHHCGSSPAEEEIFVDVLRYEVPDCLLAELKHEHRDPAIVSYRYQELTESAELHSAWILTFYERRTFIGLVHRKSESALSTP